MVLCCTARLHAFEAYDTKTVRPLPGKRDELTTPSSLALVAMLQRDAGALNASLAPTNLHELVDDSLHGVGLRLCLFFDESLHIIRCLIRLALAPPLPPLPPLSASSKCLDTHRCPRFPLGASPDSDSPPASSCLDARCGLIVLRRSNAWLLRLLLVCLRQQICVVGIFDV